ncbi:MAG: flagellar biosynthesis protein FlhB [Candidatus Obscuribacterales bacterium]|nr:flagellar biosynthesis protein FlhB [Steroidobacteraceae bacterium]
MADSDQQERTEQATQKRLDEARKRGDIPRSRDLSSAAVMMAGGIGMYALGEYTGSGLFEMMRTSLSLPAEALAHDGDLPRIFMLAFGKAALACAPIFGLIMLAATLAPLALGGWSFSTEALTPNFERLSPGAGFKRMFSLMAVVELVKSLAKFGVVALVAIVLLRKQTGELLSLGSEPTQQAVLHAIKLCGQAFIILSAGLLLIAAVDVPYQLWQYAKKLKMSRQDVRQEMKESEGSPEIKGRIRQVQQEMARRRMMQDVPKADVVVTNPTHYAVALRYDENRMRAPIVVAKGAGEIAAKIRELANQHRVPIFEAPPLARTLHRHVEIGGEVPQRLYTAVAQVLTYIFQLRAAERGLALMPMRPYVEVNEVET